MHYKPSLCLMLWQAAACFLTHHYAETTSRGKGIASVPVLTHAGAELLHKARLAVSRQVSGLRQEEPARSPRMHAGEGK